MYGNTVKTESYNGYKIEIFIDDSDINPRIDFDNLSKMVCFHSRYILGDKTNLKSSMFNGWNDLEKHLIKKCNAVIIFPLYLYDHSGITISTTPFSCPWDSGQVGYVYVTKEDIKKEYSIKRISTKVKEEVKNIVNAEVKTYDLYLTDQVYRYNITKEDTEENIDSCGGYITDDYNELVSECKSIIDNLNKKA